MSSHGNDTARGEVDRLAAEAAAAGGRPNASAIARQVGVSDRTVRHWLAGRPATSTVTATVTKLPVGKPAVPSPPAGKSDRRAGKSDRQPGKSTIDVALVAIVAVAVAVVSASHIVDLAVHVGHGWRAWLAPFALDGMAVAGVRALQQGRHRVMASAGVACGVAGSVAANVLAVRPDLVDAGQVSAVLAAFPPLALAVVVHLFRR